MKEIAKNGSYKILVIGASGETGRIILKYIKSRHPKVRLYAGGRHEVSDIQEAEFVKIDINEHNSAVSIVSDFDLVIASCGPMERVLAKVHDICLDAKVDVIDINDSAKAAKLALENHNKAQKSGIRIYSGMGMSPGLTSIMLRSLAEQKLSDKGIYRARICMGTSYGGGPTSTYAMLDNLVPEIPVFKDSQISVIKNPWVDERASFQFQGKSKKLSGVHYATPEMYALSSDRYPRDKAPVTEYDIRCTMEGFPVMAAKIISLLNRPGKMRDFLARLFYKSGQKMKGKKNSDPDNQIVLYPDDAEDQGIMLFGDVSSYDLTAGMVASMVDSWLSGKLTEKPGSYTVELLTPESFKSVIEALDARSIYWKSVLEVRRSREPWGWLERDPNQVSTLRHFGENWYTVKIHPRMQKVQSQILYDSRLWEEIKKNCSKVKLASFVVKMLLSWRKNIKALKAYTERNKLYKDLVRDMGMFCAGYKETSNLLGEKKAYLLYKEMFLTAGGSEMTWFMPIPETFMRFKDPASAVLEYFSAMLKKNAELGFLTFKSLIDESQEKKRVHFEIGNCIYASIFKELGCGELADLIRLEEMQELNRITKDMNISYDYKFLGEGDADIVFTLN